MVDDLEGILDEQEARLTHVQLATTQITGFIGQLARETDFAKASLEERSEVADILSALRDIEVAARARRQVIEQHIINAAMKAEAKEFRIEDGTVRIEARTSYVTQDAAMHDALIELIPKGDVTKDEVESAIATVISYKPDHRKLNALLKRGGRVQAAIESHREKQEGPPHVKINRKGGQR